MSSRQIEREIDISRATTLNILKSSISAYLIHLVHELKPNYIQMRIEFCNWALKMIKEDLEFFRYVVFSDESKIYDDATLNRHSCPCWSD